MIVSGEFDPDSAAGRELVSSLYEQEPDAWPDEVMLALLRRRYSAPTIPPCRICGAKLSIQAIGGGRPTEWACDGREDDPEHPGESRFKEGRAVADEHYSASRVTDYRQGGDVQVVDLTRRYLEVGERLADALDTLKRLADASEAAMGTEPDMPTYESTMDEVENRIDEARQLLKNEAEEP